MVIYLDDLFFLLLGLSWVVSIVVDVEYLLKEVFLLVNGFCFCMGFFGVWFDNDLLQMVKCFGECIYFIYLWVIQCDVVGNFFEVNYLEGDVDMYVVMKSLLVVVGQQGVFIFMCFDYGYKMLDDLMKCINFGYFVIGCL